MAKTTSKMLFVRMKEHERLAVDALAADYGMDTSEFVRCVLDQFARERPALTKKIVPMQRSTSTDRILA